MVYIAAELRTSAVFLNNIELITKETGTTKGSSCRRFTKNQYYFSVLFLHQNVGGIVVSIAAFQAVDPGSIPGRRNNCSFI